jgi:serine/threonine protein kinase
MIRRARVTDFGLSRETKHDDTGPGHTRSTVGPFRSMAPEAFRLQYSQKTDVYSFGVLIWEMLTRQLPWYRCISLFLSP